MSLPMKTWDAEVIGKQFAFSALLAEIIARKLSERIKGDPKGQSDFVQDLHDHYLAEWFVYDSFARHACLASRETFLAEAKNRLESFHHKIPGCFSLENFQKHWRIHMNALIYKYENA
jgi:hypothetical protein